MTTTASTVSTTMSATQYVNVHALGQIAWLGLVAGAGLVAVYAVGLVGVGRYQQARRDGGAGVPFLAGAAVCFLAVVACIALGVNLMLDK
jgi:hypothetical protein